MTVSKRIPTGKEIVDSCFIEVRFGSEFSDMAQVEPRHFVSRQQLAAAIDAALAAARETQAEADAKIAWGMLSNHWGDKVAAAIRAAGHQTGEGEKSK